MDPRLLRYYNQELRYLREMGGEFAREFPKIAGRLGMEGLEVADPYVERLLEGSAFLAARVQLKQDAEFPRLAQALLDIVCPNLGAPIPSMLVAKLEPSNDPNLMAGFTLPRGSALMSQPTSLGPTRCEFRTAQPVTLTPIQVTQVEYFLSATDINLSGLPLRERPKSGVRVKLALPDGMSFAKLPLDSLRFFMGGLQDVALKLHELATCRCVGVLAGPGGKDARRNFLPPGWVRHVGLADDEAMLPVTLRGLSGTRLMQEYFAFPQRFLFLDVAGLRASFAACPGNTFELVLLFDRYEPSLEGGGEPANFSLNCVPAINLFERRAERIAVDDSSTAFQVIPDRLAGNDYEVFDVASVAGFSNDSDELQFLPLFDVPHVDPGGAAGYFSLLREPRLASDRAKREGPRSAYVGSEVFLALVDLQRAPYRDDLRQLAAKVRCTNRDLPLFMPTGRDHGGLTLETRAPVETIAVVAGPSRPVSATREGPLAWRLLSLLSLNYLSLVDEDAERGALALRELLGLFGQSANAGLLRQIEGVRSVATRPVVRRHPAPGPIAFGRGLEVQVTVDELSFEGGSAALLGAVLHHYFSRHVSMNSFVQTLLVSRTRGELKRWHPLPGARAIL
ncbi:type VI secretion system baseplate subunit TssF [Roseateles asaccharophilus]|uniref:Type VI secretion system protein ImpG n=1 Tax=Roseateles asaccharophilus TaxID=582607 RepID=A0ABU2ABG6_9BURK|nr:type VI secretion system baseplate subunit TssF [Roseateles asaccharophilus]MDR7333837.1 type VI secretion system protein ImpG [Roseateles asaccharophilus]